MKFIIIIHYTKSRIRVLYASISKLVCICSKCSHDEIEECHQARISQSGCDFFARTM